MCGIWPLFHRCSSLSAFLLSPPQLRQSLCTHLHATHLSLSFFLPPSLTIQIYYIDVNQADEPTIVKKHCPVACNVCTPLNCEDNADYRDPGGFPCGEWEGYECGQAAENFGFSLSQQILLLQNCKEPPPPTERERERKCPLPSFLPSFLCVCVCVCVPLLFFLIIYTHILVYSYTRIHVYTLDACMIYLMQTPFNRTILIDTCIDTACYNLSLN